MRVIAKAYGDKPIDRFVVASTARLAYLVEADNEKLVVDDGLSGVGFPRDCVFEFDSSLMSALLAAWKAGDRTKLYDLWGRCERARFQSGSSN